MPGPGNESAGYARRICALRVAVVGGALPDGDTTNERPLPRPVECLHVIGGGCRNRLLNRLTEEATGIPVLAGPVEATAIGNLLVQAEACGKIKNKNEIQIII